MRERLTLRASVVDALRRHAAAEAPREACGLLSGAAGSGVASVFRAARNAADSAYLYRIDPGEVVRLVDELAAAGEELLAIVHSHPASPAAPSATDLREAAWHDVLHVIVSLDGRVPEGQRVRAWRIRDGAPEEMALDLA